MRIVVDFIISDHVAIGTVDGVPTVLERSDDDPTFEEMVRDVPVVW